MTRATIEPAELVAMLTYARPYKSKEEREFVARFVAPLAPTADAFGNHMVRIGTAPILWSCHTDTVHAQGGRQRLTYADGIVTLKGGRAGQCLGADDAAGVWLMAEMIRAGVPGLYVFHRGEEKGGLGSAWIADNTPELLADISFAIAFDRKGYNSIITHQIGERCCSAAFAAQLGERLGADLGYTADSTGVFTDTANYMYLVPECTNLSVGYDREHGPTEWVDFGHLKRLRDVMVGFDPASLRAYRSPDRPVYEYHYPTVSAKSREYEYTGDLGEFCWRNPEIVAAFLERQGFTVEDIANDDDDGEGYDA